MSAGTIGRGLADTFDVAIYLAGAVAFLALAGGWPQWKIRRRWRVLKTRGLRR